MSNDTCAGLDAGDRLPWRQIGAGKPIVSKTSLRDDER